MLSEIFSADSLVTGLPVLAAEPAAFVAQKFHLALQRLRQRKKLVKRLVQPEIRHDETEGFALQLLTKLGKIGQHFGRGRNEVELRIGGVQIVQQQVGMDDHTVLRTVCLRKQAAECIADRICEMRLGQKRIAERQAGGKTVFLRQRQNCVRILIAAAYAPAAPKAAFRRTVNRGNLAPVVKILPMRPVKRQKDAIKVIKFKQAGKMKLCALRFVHRSGLLYLRSPGFHVETGALCIMG